MEIHHLWRKSLVKKIKKPLDIQEVLCYNKYNKRKKDVIKMVEVIDFILANAKSIVSYEVIDYNMDVTIIEFSMANGEKVRQIY